MRDILFRGKRKDNQIWVEGFYLCLYGDEDLHIIVSKDGQYHHINKETLSQYTGFTDKNGKKIFEGDVVKSVIVRDLVGGTENREETGIIGYDKIGMIGLIAKYAGTIPVWSDFFQELTLSGCINDFWFEVIGNIFDNKNLLNNQEVCE